MPLIKGSSAATTSDHVLTNPVIVGGKPLGYADAKDRRISRQGLFQAALQSQGVMVHAGETFETYLEKVKAAAEAGLKFVNE